MSAFRLAFMMMVFVFGVAHCSSSGSPSGGSAGADSDASVNDGNGGSSGSGGTGGDASNDVPDTCASTNCDDGFNCTIDLCASGACKHSIGPSSGATACPATQYCTLDQGCVASAIACSTDADCVTAYKALPNAACYTSAKCESASSVCTFKWLDKDSDGYPPAICNGSDCDDGNPSIHPGGTEICDGIDDDCNGVLDNGATCESLHACVNGACTCLPANKCGSDCTDFQNDNSHCGSCDNSCLYQEETCVGTTCKCNGANETRCPTSCVDLQVGTPYSNMNTENCGTCGHSCGVNEICEAGQCKCTTCGGTTCIDLKTDLDNCGSCGSRCSMFLGCENGTCHCDLCNGNCKNFQRDVYNCGSCDNVCGYYETCTSGQCVCDTAGQNLLCNGVCVGPSSVTSCGACNVQCPVGDTCGVHRSLACDAGLCSSFWCCSSWSDSYCATHGVPWYF